MSGNSSVNLYKLKLPEDLRELSYEQCDEICSQIRGLLIDTVSQNGGHLASNLGVVELTMAIHRVFDPPKDKIIWDTSHQSYTHKILTGRLDRFESLRESGGISGFTRPSESKYDAFVCGHASTAVSAALGYASAMRIKGDRRHCSVAIVGDGAATGGMFFEGLNNAGKSNTNTIVILNHNEMSISKNVGGFAKYLSTLRTTETYIKTRDTVNQFLRSTPIVGKPIAKTISVSKNAFKEILLHSTLFEDMGFEYLGPIDGHNLSDIENALRLAKSMKKPVIVHVNTVKGKGYPPAEANSGEFHAVGAFEIATGNPDVTPSDSYSGEFGKVLCELAETNRRICAVTAAMKHATGLAQFSKRYPARFFDVGIAEEHAVTFCAGLASSGMTPVFAVYSTFLQRSYDQLIHDAAICGLHIVLGIDRAGAVGGDGETHQGIFDVPMLTTIPNTTIYSPSCYAELRLCLEKAICEDEGICAVRYPKTAGDKLPKNEKPTVSYTYKKHGSKVLAVTYGRLYRNVNNAYLTLKKLGLSCDVLKLVKVFPFTDNVKKIIGSYDKVFVFEESSFEGSVAQRLMEFGNVEPVCVRPFMPQASAAELLDECGLSTEKITDRLREALE